MPDRCDHTDDQELIELIDAIGEARDNGSQDFKNDHDEEHVVDALDHAVWKERKSCKEAFDAEVKGTDSDTKECEC